MKKIFSGLVLILCLSLVTAGVLLSRENTLSAFDSYKSTRESDISSVINVATSSIVYTSDKVCEINYNTELFECYVCFDYSFELEGDTISPKGDECISVEEESLKKDYDKEVNEFVTRRVREDYPEEEYSYVKETIKGERSK